MVLLVGMSAESQVVSLLRGEILNIVFGTFFLVLAAVAAVIAATRRRSGTRILVWLALWSALFGANDLAKSVAIRALPAGCRPILPAIVAIAAYLLLIAGTLAFRQLSQGWLRHVLWGILLADSLVAVAGLVTYFRTGVGNAFTAYNNALAALTLAMLVTAAAVPRLSRRYIAVGGHGALTAGIIIFAAQALYANLANVAGWPNPGSMSSLGFAVLLLSFGYTAMQ
jgi:hypothetical protein